MKISNWESIPYSVGLQCPNGDDGSLMDGKSKVIGWCDTPIIPSGSNHRK